MSRLYPCLFLNVNPCANPGCLPGFGFNGTTQCGLCSAGAFSGGGNATTTRCIACAGGGALTTLQAGSTASANCTGDD